MYFLGNSHPRLSVAAAGHDGCVYTEYVCMCRMKIWVCERERGCRVFLRNSHPRLLVAAAGHDGCVE